MICTGAVDRSESLARGRFLAGTAVHLLAKVVWEQEFKYASIGLPHNVGAPAARETPKRGARLVGCGSVLRGHRQMAGGEAVTGREFAK